MNPSQDNPNDTFWLARYAHNTLTPVIESLPGRTDKVFAYLYLGMTAHPQFPGLCIYVHQMGLQGMVDSNTYRVTKESIDTMAKLLPGKWLAMLNAPVTA